MTTAKPPTVQGIHFVGSIPYEDSATVFSKCGAHLGRRLRRIPDGEPGERNNWIVFQLQLFSKYPSAIVPLPNWWEEKPPPADGEIKAAVEELAPLETGYDTCAIESYQQFKSAKQAGQIPGGTRFMVAIPTMVGFVGSLISTAWQPAIEPLYTDALQRAIRNIQATIPHEELAIQLDFVLELAILDAKLRPAWFPGDPFEGCMQRVMQLIDVVAGDVELGFHFCYGDLGHKHWKEPDDLGWVNKCANELKRRSGRPIAFMQMPVPISRDDEAYFEPLQELVANQGATEIYLGLVHPNDVAGTQRRIAAAGKTIPKFGVATECGMGRTPGEEIESIMNISADVAAPWPA